MSVCGSRSQAKDAGERTVQGRASVLTNRTQCAKRLTPEAINPSSQCGHPRPNPSCPLSPLTLECIAAAFHGLGKTNVGKQLSGPFVPGADCAAPAP